MSASGCVSKWAARLGLELSDLAVQFGDDGHGGAVVAANAVLTVAGGSCSVRSAAANFAGTRSILRWRPRV